jgi:GT2 family glycosyltransferase
MPLYKNTSLQTIQAVVNGSRRKIKPGQQIEGPESLGIIPGMSIVGPIKCGIINPNHNTPISIPVSMQEMKMSTIEPINPNIVSDYSEQIDRELKYLEHMKGFNHNPEVTVAILTKNHLNLIVDCFESIFKMVKYPHVTILIADTGTNEPAVRKYYETIPRKCETKGWKYKFVQFHEYSFGRNYNEIVKNHVDTEYVLIQNNDTVALNDYVSEMMATGLQRCVGSTGCRMLYRDGNIQHDGQFFYTGHGRSFNGAGHVHLRHRKDSVPPSFSFTHLVDGNTAAGVLMRKKEFIDIGGFDEGYKDIFQDVDLMMKISPMLNKFNYCNRMANIIHLDNASRLGQGNDPVRQAQMWEDTHYLKTRLTSNNWGRAKDPKQVDFSVVTIVYNMENYREFCNSLRKQYGTFTIEVIGIPNFFNFFKSAYKALNTASDLCNGKNIIFCHDDIVVEKDWLHKINKHIVELDAQNVPWGVLGPAGVVQNGNNSPYFLLDNATGEPIWKTQSNILHDAARYEVASLDELCLIVKKSNNLRFNDQQLSGFHFYGGNICIEAHIKGLKTFAIDAYCKHKSDGSKNVSTSEGYKNYENAAKMFHVWAKLRGIGTWRTTTALSVNGNLNLYIKRP